MSIYDKLREHVGHEIVCVQYGNGSNISVECEDCMQVLIDADHPDTEE